jgi:hypothetical protein
MALRKCPAAFMGPIVWELDGPGPVLNRSKTEVSIKFFFIFTPDFTG